MTNPAPSVPSNFSEAESSSVVFDSKSSSSSWSSQGRTKVRSNTDPPRMIPLKGSATGKSSSVTWDRTDIR